MILCSRIQIYTAHQIVRLLQKIIESHLLVVLCCGEYLFIVTFSFIMHHFAKCDIENASRDKRIVKRVLHK